MAATASVVDNDDNDVVLVLDITLLKFKNVMPHTTREFVSDVYDSRLFQTFSFLAGKECNR